MAARSISSFVLTFGLVAIPVKLYTATSAVTVGFNMLHKGCGSRLKQQMICPADDGKVVERADTERGFEYAADQYVKFSDEEMKALEAERDDSLELLEFVPASSVDPLQVEKSQYLGPGKGGDRGYLLLSLALQDTNRVAVGRWRTRSKDTLVVIRPYAENGLVMHQVYYATEVRPFGEIARDPKVQVRASELQLARKLVEQLASPALDTARYYDTWAEKIMKAVEAKAAGEEFVAPPAGPKAEVFDLLEALQRSVGTTAPPSGAGVKKAAPRTPRQKAAAGRRISRRAS